MSERLERARSFGQGRHEGQRYGDAPYEAHLAAVEAVLRRFGVSDEDVLVAAHLHDVVEDTGTTLAEVEAEFGARVAWIVDHVTNRPGETRRAMHEATYPRLRDVLPAVQLKLADRIANVEAALEWDVINLFRMYQSEHAYFRTTVRTPGHLDDMWDHLDALLGHAASAP